ncbi:MAG: oxygen-dependent coproporphyrinogen oxidase [Proteobacteria bacterium]|nr:oxygen-dependent coproporphyrinogen oxidase [Pseudomonadota bacterium]
MNQLRLKPTPQSLPTPAQKQRAACWFTELQGQFCVALEEIEQEYATQKGGAVQKFQRKDWIRETHDNVPGGGGNMALLKGQVFEKAGVNASEVFGQFSKEFRAQIPGADGAVAVARSAEQSRQEYEDGAFWAAGISLVVHPRNPKIPAVHMNTRHIATRFGWFGGVADLNPVFPDAQDVEAFHAALGRVCGTDTPAWKKECDEYFTIKHRKKPRGAGGVFFDDLNRGDWEADFALVQALGEAVLKAYPAIARRHLFESYTPEEREAQLVWRGHYAEFNLVYDRGTKFGLMTGGNVDAVLMSLPPEAKWL